MRLSNFVQTEFKCHQLNLLHLKELAILDPNNPPKERTLLIPSSAISRTMVFSNWKLLPWRTFLPLPGNTVMKVTSFCSKL